MPTLIVRNLPDEVHRALFARAALHGRSIEVEVRSILKETLFPEGRNKLGSLLTAIGRQAELSEEEFANFVQRDAAPTQPIDLG